jgi:pimeloyl-ACP methyl ester carboxylesterase
MLVLRQFAAMVLIAATIAAKPVSTIHPDDIMDVPLPTAALARWTDAPGRRAVALNVPGATLRGFVYAGGRSSAPVLLMFGGSGNLIVRHDGASRALARDAAEVAFYDYRGYGFSSGKAHFRDLEGDALRIYDAVSTNATGRVVVLGFSMGTAIAEYVALHRHATGLILCAPWNDYVVAENYGGPKTAYVLAPDSRALFDEVAMVQRIHAPLLVLQGTLDDAIPPQQGRALERAAASPDKRFVPIAGAKHNRLLENPQTQAAVRRFLDR